MAKAPAVTPSLNVDTIHGAASELDAMLDILQTAAFGDQDLENDKIASFTTVARRQVATILQEISSLTAAINRMTP